MILEKGLMPLFRLHGRESSSILMHWHVLPLEQSPGPRGVSLPLARLSPPWHCGHLGPVLCLEGAALYSA